VGRGVRRGELWLARVGRKQRPVLVLTRSEVIDVRELVTVAEVTTSFRGLAAEVEVDHVEVGLDRPSVINCDGIHTIAQGALTGPIGQVGEATMRDVCSAVSYAVGC
jgi:mRNA-degrading endonuclease toxin of MazEF toxin-antitoxin module